MTKRDFLKATILCLLVAAFAVQAFWNTDLFQRPDNYEQKRIYTVCYEKEREQGDSVRKYFPTEQKCIDFHVKKGWQESKILLAKKDLQGFNKNAILKKVSGKNLLIFEKKKKRQGELEWLRGALRTTLNLIWIMPT